MISLITSLALCASTLQSAPAARPNLVLIVTDDLGYGDLGCYGQEQLATPNIDRLAAEGRRYTQFYAGSTVCAPSRCVLMTGLHTGHALIRGNGKQDLRPEDETLAEVLHAAGYRTGCFGKWGIGHEGTDGMPTRQGFDRFFGYLDQSHAHNYYPSFLIDGERRVALDNVVPNEGEYGQGVASEKRQYSHDLIMDRALSFLDEESDAPFFLYLPWTLPHANNQAGKAGMEVPELGSFAERDWPAPEQGFAAMLALIDRDVGRVLAKLEATGQASDTLVLFTSDNGPHNEGGHDAEFFESRGPLRGTKRSLTEGGIRVPLIARWPGQVAAGSVSAHIGAFQDFLPTFAELARAADHLPARHDGLSFAPDLLARGEQRSHEYLYWAFYEGGCAQALRVGRWKAVQQPFKSAVRLYDLDADLGENEDVAAQHPQVVADMQATMRAAYTPSQRWKLPD
jgi:arylsulfatase A-like enzyme